MDHKQTPPYRIKNMLEILDELDRLVVSKQAHFHTSLLREQISYLREDCVSMEDEWWAELTALGKQPREDDWY